TQEVVLKANLNSGPIVESFSPAYSVPSGAPVLPFTTTQPAVDDNGFPIESGDIGVMFNEVGEAFSLQAGQGVWASFRASTFTGGAVVGGLAANSAESITFDLDDGSTKTVNFTFLAGNTAAQNAAIEAAAINSISSVTGITATVNASDQVVLTNDNGNASASHNISVNATSGANTGFAAGNADQTAWRYKYNPTGPTTGANADKEFNTIASLREALENQALAEPGASGIEVIVNDQGKLELTNTDAASYDINLKITGLSGGGVTENTRFTRSMEAMNAVLQAGTAGRFDQI
ncbi:MAG: flagellar hook protein FlgE, partial [Thiotrichales bacterium]|nr:flagellar hook protein FlgE [Thiotrichales bacterium]